jgi:regulator of sigma E protease
MTLQLALALPTLAGLGKILVFLVMISILIVLHEYGHFIVARRNGVRVNDFALGMGPTLLRWTSPRSGTNYLLNLLPIGGYCAMKGEDGKTNEAEQQRQFRESVDVVNGSRPGSPGVSTSGVALLPERTVLSDRGAAGGYVRVMHEEDNFQAKRPLQRLAIVVAGPDGAGHVVGIIGFMKVLAPQRVPLGTALARSGEDFAMIWTSTFGALGGLFTHPAATAGQLHGVVGMASVSGEVQDAGWGAYLSFAALISISLGIFNLLPIPALDGGRGVFIIAEILRGKPVDPEKEALVHVGGFAVLIVLMLAVSYHDVANLVSGKGAF